VVLLRWIEAVALARRPGSPSVGHDAYARRDMKVTYAAILTAAVGLQVAGCGS